MRRGARRERRAAGGFTLIEIIVVIAIMGLLMGSAVVGLRSLNKSDMRTSIAKFSGACRYLFDRASTTGRTHRLVIDIDVGAYWAETTDDRFFVPRDLESEETKKRDEEEEARETEEHAKLRELADSDRQAYERLEYEPQNFKRKRVRFAPFKDTTLPSVRLKGAKIVDLYTPRLAEPATAGQVHIYFFPMGQTEPAIVHFSDEKGESRYSVVVHPITGRVKVYDRWIESPVGERFDDEGNRVVEE